MNSDTKEHLYNLLPVLYHLRDHAQGEPLRALFGVLEQEWQALQNDISGLYDNWFIETCADWVIPYIGDLVGNRPLYEIEQLRRTDVAKTIYYRRRKGTLAMLEELARDVTGWGVHAVEFFQLLGWTQHLNHLRYELAENGNGRFPTTVNRVGTVNLRSGDFIDRLHGPFDRASHTVDVRPIGRTQGWHNINNVGFFVWRLRHYPLVDLRPRQSLSHPYGYHFSSLGNPSPIFNNPLREAEATGLAGETHIPGPIRPYAFYTDLQQYAAQFAALPPTERPNSSNYYGPDHSFSILKNGQPIMPLDVMCKDLKAWERPPAGKVAVDVRLGRMTFALGEEPQEVQVATTYGFSSDMGGGPYDRRDSLIDPNDVALYIPVAKGTAVETLQAAVQEWTVQGQPRCLIEITDNGIYGGNLDITLPADGWLAIQAANGRRPNVRLVGVSSLAADEGGEILLSGLLIEGAFELNGRLHLTLHHCTLVPGRSLTEAGNPAFPDRDSLVVGTETADLAVTIYHSIVGSLRLPTNVQGLAAYDSLIHAPEVAGEPRAAIAADDLLANPGPPTILERTTVFGEVYVKELTLASEVIFNQRVQAQRRQVGCVRFSYVPPGSRVPRRYRCQPDLALWQRAQALGLDSTDALPPAEVDQILVRVKPEYTSERYGDPAYAQLSLTCPAEITTGAADGAEMGVFCSLKQPQREANLRIRLDEYLPFGLTAGLIYIT